MSAFASRRAILGAIAVTPLSAVPSLARGARADAALVALASEVEALIARSNQLERDVTAAEELIDEMTGPALEDPRDSIFIGSGPEFRRVVDRYFANQAERSRRATQIEERIGYDALLERCNAAYGEVVTARERLAGLKATSLAGVLAKARVAERADWAELDRSVVADLVTIAGGQPCA